MTTVLSAIWSRVRALPVTLVYGAVLAAVAAALIHLGPQVQARVIRYASTNLHNLGEGRLGTLVGSAFVNEAGPVYLWLPGLLALLALGELLWRSHRLVVAFAVGHVGATVIVAAGLVAALAAGLLSASVADAADVGMSYGAVGVLGTFTAAMPGRWRATWAGGWLAAALASAVLSGGEFTNAGHAVALVLGMAVGSRFAPVARWTAVRCALLAVAAGFGFLLIAYDTLQAQTVAVWAAAGALAGFAVATVRQRNSSAEASIQSESHAVGGSSSNSPGISHS